MIQRTGTLVFAALISFLWILPEALAGSTEFKRWASRVPDINGNPITVDTFRNKVTVVSFSTKESRGTAMRLGQEIGQEFGHRPNYQSLAIPNTSNVPYWAKFIVKRKAAAFQRKAVAEAAKRQIALGNYVTQDQIRKKIIFINDTDGHVWEHLGVNPHSVSTFVGVIDKFGNLVYLEESPFNMRELFRKLEFEFQK